MELGSRCFRESKTDASPPVRGRERLRPSLDAQQVEPEPTSGGTRGGDLPRRLWFDLATGGVKLLRTPNLPPAAESSKLHNVGLLLPIAREAPRTALVSTGYSSEGCHREIVLSCQPETV